MWLFIIPLILYILYALLIAYYRSGWRQLKQWEAASNESAQVKLSLIIPARNEEENIPQLLRAIEQQSYPASLTEVIVIDDHSTDRTAEIASEFPFVKLIRLQDSANQGYKKQAISTGIAAASGELIVCTDADCIPGPEWLQIHVNGYLHKQAAFIAAPVRLTGSNNLLTIFQILDFVSLQGITGAAVQRNFHSMCNGANLSYPKKAFEEVNGFAGVDDIASGDDMLLMHKIAGTFPGRIIFLKNEKAIVDTAAATTWRAFLQQRIRWASKARLYDDKRIIWALLLVYLFNLCFLLLLILGFWRPVFWQYFLLLWIFKTIAEAGFVKEVAIFFDQQQYMRYFFLFQPLHIFYTIIAGWLGQVKTYEWKGRKLR